MNLPIVLLIGAGIGALIGAMIFFEKKEPYKLEIVIASIFRNALVALLVRLSVQPGSSWLACAGFGLLYGFWTGLVVFMAKGGLKSHDAPFVVPGATVVGGLTGLAIAFFIA